MHDLELTVKRALYDSWCKEEADQGRGALLTVGTATLRGLGGGDRPVGAWDGERRVCDGSRLAGLVLLACCDACMSAHD